jgi:large subunit ribosomal protein L21
MYAIVKVGSKQYRVEKGDSLLVDRMPEDEGAKVNLEPVMFRSDDIVFDRAGLDKVKVEAVVTGHQRGPKIHVLKYKPKKGYKRRTGHRSELTRLEIGDIKVLTRKPASKKAGEDKPAAAKKPAAKKPAAKKPAARKPAAKKTQEKKNGS